MTEEDLGETVFVIDIELDETDLGVEETKNDIAKGGSIKVAGLDLVSINLFFTSHLGLYSRFYEIWESVF